MSLIDRIHHVAYRCKDARQTVEWYEKHLGMQFVLAIAEIPEAQRESYGATHFLRAIAIYSREQDRTVAWRCPDCGHEWERE